MRSWVSFDYFIWLFIGYLICCVVKLIKFWFRLLNWHREWWKNLLRSFFNIKRRFPIRLVKQTWNFQVFIALVLAVEVKLFIVKRLQLWNYFCILLHRPEIWSWVILFKPWYWIWRLPPTDEHFVINMRPVSFIYINIIWD